MEVKRYVAENMRQAMNLVREDQGPDAFILSNKRTVEGVEVVVAVDYSEEEASQSTESTVDMTSGYALLTEDIRLIRSMLENQYFSATTKADNQHPQIINILKRLQDYGLSDALAKNIVTGLNPVDDELSLWGAALSSLAQMLPVSEYEFFAKTNNIVALVGATGVGKTTTIAKLAARLVFQHKGKKIALFTTDNYRVGAHEQLRNYARILGLPVRVIMSVDDLKQALIEFSDYDYILIDTAGLGHRDSYLSAQLKVLKEQGAIDIALVLSATTQRQNIIETIRTYHALDVDSCIITKVDESASLGAILSAVIEAKLAVSYFTDGQSVPEDIHIALAHNLVRRGDMIIQDQQQLADVMVG